MIFTQMPGLNSRFFIVLLLDAVLLVEHRETGQEIHCTSSKQKHDAADWCQYR